MTESVSSPALSWGFESAKDCGPFATKTIPTIKLSVTRHERSIFQGQMFETRSILSIFAPNGIQQLLRVVANSILEYNLDVLDV